MENTQLLQHLSPCVFSIWDDIRKVDHELCDFVYISKEAPKNHTEAQLHAPHIGPAWRTKEVAAWLLNRGIISWDDIPFGIDCTCRLPAGYLQKALDSLDGAWEGVSPLHKKLACNAMIGLWANPKQYTFQTKVHEPEYDDTLFEGAKVRRELKEFSLHELVLRFEQCSNSTMATLHRQIMDAEALLSTPSIRNKKIH